MRFRWTIACALWFAGNCFGGTITDTFGQSQYSCILTYTSPYTTCDVVGNEMLYDIQKATVSFGNGVATISIDTNTGAVPYGATSLTLGAFHDAGDILMPGDIFFYNPTTGYNPDDPSTIANLQYGVALTDHGGFTAGGLYAIADGVSTEDAQVALQDGSDFYRWDETVLMTGEGAAASSGSVTVARIGDGVHTAEYRITATVPLTSGLLDLESNGQIGLLFSSADCGNDVIQGVVTTGDGSRIGVAVASVPEPGPGALVLLGVALLLAGKRWPHRRG
ncbi:MAG TPA: hypothetical protein VHW09_25530 [Bryobacteraceae bacterium]|jgi:hypothetical protein|nr:hypothetical protein [Bryobacteraceae bacterium]